MEIIREYPFAGPDILRKAGNNMKIFFYFTLWSVSYSQFDI